MLTMALRVGMRALLPGCMLALVFVAAAKGEEASFARLEAEPPTVYAGQPFTLKLSIFTTGQDLEPGMQISGLPDAIQLQPFQDMPAVSQTENGQVYQVLRSKCDAICPQPGRLEFAPVIHGVSSRAVQTFFFVQRVRNAVQIPVRPITLEVKPIPMDQAPKDYTGLIGVFQLAASLSTNRVLPGDLVTLTSTVSGRGRFDLLPPLGLPSAPGFKVYPARLDSTRSAGNVRTYTQVLIPMSDDSRVIPAWTLVAFNPDQGAFDTFSAGPFSLVEDTGRPTNLPATIIMPLATPEGAPPPPLPIHPSIGRWLGDIASRQQAESYFTSGNQSYHDGRLTEAIDAYAKILALGARTPEVHANLGATYARNGQYGKAMLYLLGASRAQPRDRITRRLLLQLIDTSATPFPPSLPFWSHFSRNEWLALAGLSLGLGLLAMGFARSKKVAFPTRLLATIMLPVFLVALAGVAWWTAGPPFSERVVTAPVVQGRLAPTDMSAPTVRLTEAMVVNRVTVSGPWAQVMAGALTVWLPNSAIQQP